MKELTQSLRALADLLDRPEFEGVRAPDVCRMNGEEIAWDLEGFEIYICKDAWQFWSTFGAGRVSFNPTAKTLPADLLRELERLKSS